VVTSSDNDQPVESGELGSVFSAFRAALLDQWRARVTAEIPAAAALDEPVLVNMVPKLYDRIAAALAADESAALAIAGTNLGTTHGRERANMTDYSPMTWCMSFKSSAKCCFR